VAPAAPGGPALAAPLLPSQAPTMEDVDAGIDHTGRDRDLPSEFRKQSVYYRTEQPRARSSSTPPTATSI
jgi:hypothetical protein